jgi:hypothetical protein
MTVVIKVAALDLRLASERRTSCHVMQNIDANRNVCGLVLSCLLFLPNVAQPAPAIANPSIVEGFLDACTSGITNFSTLRSKLESSDWKLHEAVLPQLISKLISVDIEANEAFDHIAFHRTVNGIEAHIILNKTRTPSGAAQVHCDFILPTQPDRETQMALRAAIKSEPSSNTSIPDQVTEIVWTAPLDWPLVAEIAYSYIFPGSTLHDVFGTSGVLMGTTTNDPGLETIR